MKFSAMRSELLDGLQNILSVVPARTTLPVLGNILLEADQSKLKIAATDLDVSMIIDLPVKVVKKGGITVPAKIFTDIIREAPEAQIEVSLTDNRVEIKIEKGLFKISGIPVDEFPKLPEVNLAKQIKLSGLDLSGMIRKTFFAVSTDETRPALNGVLWQTKGDFMQMVATDGHRLAKFSKQNKKLKGLFEDIIIPPKVLNLLVKIIGDEEKEVGIIFGENNIIFSLDDMILSSRLIEGPYPNFDAVIPKDNDKKLIASKEELSRTMKRVAILANSLTHQVKFSLKKGNLELSSLNFDIGGEAKETIPCEYKGEDIEIGYNANYVMDVIKQIDGENVTFDFSTPVSAGVVYSTPQKEGEDYLCLLMPLRLVE